MGSIAASNKPVPIDEISIQKHGRFVKRQNADSIMFDELKAKKWASISSNTCIFTNSMDTIVTPATFQEQKEMTLVDIVSEDENMFPDHEITLNYGYIEKSCK